jgi:hypothetical protein
LCFRSRRLRIIKRSEAVGDIQTFFRRRTGGGFVSGGEMSEPKWKVYEGYGEKGNYCLIAAERHGFFNERRVGIIDSNNVDAEINKEYAQKICDAVNEREKLLAAAKIMHFDLLALGQIPLAEMVDMFGNKNG